MLRRWFVANAAARGIRLTATEYEVEGDLDARAFLGLDGPRAGFTAVRVKGVMSSPNATREQLVETCEYVQATSPARDSVTNTVPVIRTIEISLNSGL